MKLKFLLSLIILHMANVAMADKITKSQAIAIAEAFANGNAAMGKGKGVKASPLTMVHEATGYYAFNRGESNGYILVATSDLVAKSVLGYADSGEFDTNNMPDNMRWWLSEYDRQIEYLEANPTAAASASTETTATYTEVKPLITTQWDQRAPYNLNCPIVNNTYCLTGCNATAIAQIMKYYGHPTSGTGTKKYTDTYGCGQTLTVNFSESTYDWTNMTDTYGNTSTDEQKAAVAKLMYDAGVAMETQYGTDGSAAYTSAGIVALFNYFGYDKGMNFYPRDGYSYEKWVEMLYNELANKRPILYSGQTSEKAGHTFLIDGYRTDGYFHVNWGWGGQNDDYFSLSVLATGNDQYNFDQQATLGIKPAEENSSFSHNMYCTESFIVSSTSTEYITFGTYFFYHGLETLATFLGVKAVNSSNQENYLYNEQLAYSIPAMNIYAYYPDGGYSVPTSKFTALSNGVYSIYPVFKSTSESTWNDIACYYNDHLMAYVNNGSVFFTNVIIDEASENTITAANSTGILLLRTLSNEYWNTFCVPFALTADQITEAFGEGTKITKFNGTVTDKTMYFDEVTAIEAGVPYLIKPAKTVTNPSFTATIVEGDPQAISSSDGYAITGVYSPKALATDGTHLFLTTSGKLSQPAESTSTINGLRAYITVPAGTSGAKINISGEVSGIDDINIDGNTATEAIYTISGQYTGNDASRLAKGIYIVKGKKIIIK